MQPRDPLAELKEKYSNELSPNNYQKWLTSVQNLLQLMTMKEGLKKTTMGYVPPEENLKNLQYEIKLTERVLEEQRKLEKIIGSGINDVIYKLDDIARNTEVSAKNYIKPDKAQSDPTPSKKGFFSKSDTSTKRRGSAPTTVNDEKVDPKKIHKEGGAYDLNGPKKSH